MSRTSHSMSEPGPTYSMSPESPSECILNRSEFRLLSTIRAPTSWTCLPSSPWPPMADEPATSTRIIAKTTRDDAASLYLFMPRRGVAGAVPSERTSTTSAESSTESEGFPHNGQKPSPGFNSQPQPEQRIGNQMISHWMVTESRNSWSLGTASTAMAAIILALGTGAPPSEA